MSQLEIPFFGLKRQYSDLREEILEVTDRVLQSGQFMSGSCTQEFEQWLAVKNHSSHAVTCHSGTQALEILATFHKLRFTGDQVQPVVLIPALTYIATANAWRKAGWAVHIVDTDYRGVMDLSKLPPSSKWDAVCPVGLYGAALNPDFRSDGYDICVEDGAQHWLSNKCHRIGSTAISFDPTKNLGNYGNGGAIVTDSADVAQFALDWTRNRQTPSPHLHFFENRFHTPSSTNSRMSEVDCAQLMVKTAHLDAWQARRRDIAAYWMDKFKGTAVRALIDSTNFDAHCFHKFVIDIDDRNLVQNKLVEKKIETKVHYADPIQDIPEYQHCQGPGMLSASHSLSRRCLSLPLYPELTDAEVERIATQVIYCVS
jgi:dTDP-4-amino-4,6-dideoxygalactose transaminase